MQRIGYFGGSFDPPHRGHLTVAKAARDRFALDEVLLAPTGRQPFKPEGATASFPDRLAMTALLCKGEPGLRASDLDAPQADGAPNFTVDTLTRLEQEVAASSSLFAIVGADAFLGLPKWHDAAQLFRLAEWIVVSRPGFPLRKMETMALNAEQRARVHLLPGLADPTSATEVRARLQQQPCEGLLPAAVCQYVQEHQLYGPPIAERNNLLG